MCSIIRVGIAIQLLVSHTHEEAGADGGDVEDGYGDDGDGEEWTEEHDGRSYGEGKRVCAGMLLHRGRTRTRDGRGTRREMRFDMERMHNRSAHLFLSASRFLSHFILLLNCFEQLPLFPRKIEFLATVIAVSSQTFHFVMKRLIVPQHR